MEPSASRGNFPDKWNKLLEELDEKLQLGLLDRLRRVTSYHFESTTLYIEPATVEDIAYLEKDSVRQQLSVFSSGVGATAVLLKKKD